MGLLTQFWRFKNNLLVRFLNVCGKKRFVLVKAIESNQILRLVQLATLQKVHIECRRSLICNNHLEADAGHFFLLHL